MFSQFPNQISSSATDETFWRRVKGENSFTKKRFKINTKLNFSQGGYLIFQSWILVIQLFLIILTVNILSNKTAEQIIL